MVLLVSSDVVNCFFVSKRSIDEKLSQWLILVRKLLLLSWMCEWDNRYVPYVPVRSVGFNCFVL